MGISEQVGLYIWWSAFMYYSAVSAFCQCLVRSFVKLLKKNVETTLNACWLQLARALLDIFTTLAPAPAIHAICCWLLRSLEMLLVEIAIAIQLWVAYMCCIWVHLRNIFQYITIFRVQCLYTSIDNCRIKLCTQSAPDSFRSAFINLIQSMLRNRTAK
jgi:hypothetical protein